MKHEIGLDRSSKKFICPACGKKRLVRYFDYTDRIYFPDQYGRCDRELNCGYHLGIKEYFQGAQVSYNWQPNQKKNEQPTYLDIDVIRSSTKNYKHNNFVQFLKRLFPDIMVKEIITRYLLGTSYKWQGATIFWQVDNNSKVRSGKILLYDSINGKRIKKPFNHITWYHKISKLKDFNLSQCLFGLHLINEYPNKAISIVESEKTACIMSVLAPETIWMATGALNNINLRLFTPLINKSIILYPDASIANKSGKTCFDLWNEKSSQLKLQGFQIITSDILQKKTNQKQKELGYDLADFFIPQISPSSLASVLAVKRRKQPIVLESKETRALNTLRKINPLIDNLIEVFDLEISRNG